MTSFQVNFDFDQDHDLMATDSRISEVRQRFTKTNHLQLLVSANRYPHYIGSSSNEFSCWTIYFQSLQSLSINHMYRYICLPKFRCRETFAHWDRLIPNYKSTVFGRSVRYPRIHCPNIWIYFHLGPRFLDDIIKICKWSFPRRLILNLTLMKTYWLSTPLSVMRCPRLIQLISSDLSL